MALKFLNKKGWHTGSLRNIETVWKAEQKHEAEKRKLEELQKQIKEEQEHLEFRKLQEQAGLVPKQERLDFLYESGLGVGKPSNDEYLLGKPLEETKEESVIQQVAATPGSLFVEEKISANDQWRKIRTDPLLLIKQQELAARERIKNNPLKMEALRNEVEAKMNAKAERKRLKALMKAEEKQKRKALKKKMREEREEADDRDDGGKRSVEEDGQRRKRAAEEDVEDRHRGRAVHDNGDGYRRKRSVSEQDEDDSHRRKRVASSAGDGDEDRRNWTDDERYRRRGAASKDDEQDHRGRRAFERGNDEDKHRSARNEEDGHRGRAGDDDPRSRRHRDELDVDERRRHEDRRRENRDGIALGKPPLPRKKVQLSDEEKMARLRAMQQDAELHEEQRWQRIKKASISDAIQEEKDSIKTSKNFLEETTRSVYGTDNGGNASVADTLHRRSHYREKFTDQNAFRRS